MPIFRVRVESQESDEFRLVAVSCETEEEAKAIVAAQEARHVGFEVAADELAELEDDEKAGKLSGRSKARLYSHRQKLPYKVKRVKKDGEDK